MDNSHGSPERPSLKNPNQPPVLIKQPPPFAVRTSQFLWVLSFLAGTVAIAYLVAVRDDLVPLISEMVRDVDENRGEGTYTEAADIVFWSTFGGLLALLLFQITLLVSFMGRKKGIRWWQFITVLAQLAAFALISQMVALGDYGTSLRQLLTVQVGLALLALLMAAFPSAIAWTARQHDVRRGNIVTVN
nr:hypothetical protein [Actinomycetales bacterium]